MEGRIAVFRLYGFLLIVMVPRDPREKMDDKTRMVSRERDLTLSSKGKEMRRVDEDKSEW